MAPPDPLPATGRPAPGLRPLAFMVMPFRRKDTHAPAPAPASIDFDALWEKAFCPALTALGYEPVRADQDLGALIIKEMLERLYFSDLVVADLTIPNGNVYYEVGIRHAAQSSGCVLIGADWARPLFDVDQMRQLRYALPEGEVTESTAEAIRNLLQTSIPIMAAGTSPMFQTLQGYPTTVDRSRVDVIRRYLRELSAFEEEIRAVMLAPKSEQGGRAVALAQRYIATPPIVPAVALELLKLVRDYATADEALAYVNRLPADLQDQPFVREQRTVMISRSGDDRSALAALLELVKTHGETSERMGLIGGRYKRLAKAEMDPVERQRLLSKAIDAYDRGMRADLNDYYPSSNLPRLYRQRNRPGDADRARAAAAVAMTACLRARERTPADEWLRPTLLGMAFDAGNVAQAQELAEQVANEGPAAWKLDTLLNDLTVSIGLHRDPDTQQGLQEVFDQLKSLA